MKTFAFIPSRANSKRMPRKGLALVGGRSLVQRAVDAARGAGVTPWISTDDAEVVESLLGPGVHSMAPGLSMHSTPQGALGVHVVPTVGERTRIEDEIAVWWSRLAEKPDAVVMLQAAAPFRTVANIRDAVKMLEVGADCVVGVKDIGQDVAFSGALVAAESPDEFAEFHPRRLRMTRPFSQDTRGTVWRETGSLYAWTAAHWKATGDRMWGTKMAGLPMSEIESMDIDTPDDLAVCQAIAVARQL